MSFVFATKCEVVPFVVENNFHSYVRYKGYIYFSKSYDIADQCRSNVTNAPMSGTMSPMSLHDKDDHDSPLYSLQGGSSIEIWSKELMLRMVFYYYKERCFHELN